MRILYQTSLDHIKSMYETILSCIQCCKIIVRHFLLFVTPCRLKEAVICLLFLAKIELCQSQIIVSFTVIRIGISPRHSLNGFLKIWLRFDKLPSS